MRKEPALVGLQKVDFISLLAASMAAGSVFLPWFRVESLTSYAGYTHTHHYGLLRGTFVEGGWAGLSLSLFSLIMVFLRVRWSGLASLTNTFIGTGYLLGWVDLSGKFLQAPSQKYNSILHVEPQAGLYVFLFSSLVCTMTLFQKRYAFRESVRIQNPS
ncbi:MAG: hypothetical protein ACKO41_01985 [Sphingomonadales bacterium]